MIILKNLKEKYGLIVKQLNSIDCFFHMKIPDREMLGDELDNDNDDDDDDDDSDFDIDETDLESYSTVLEANEDIDEFQIFSQSLQSK